MSRNRYITVVEYGRIHTGDVFGDVVISQQDMMDLRQFIDDSNSSDASIADFLKPIRNGVQVNNYVGVLKTKSGLTIEVLPKISSKTEQINQVKQLFFDMLRTVKDC
ncbi:5-methylcytosine restriction system specificity protein McrC [Macrococcus carouselicus]|uniref:5-methylcytosine restriction system specificity protein McrC n=1 Tax=Macrococcus carouselicus TaxID=69969 RepID=UPI001AA07D1E|nr:hypothetical protein [Macrococcus carouselicus]